MVWNQEVDDPFNHKRTVSFSRMHSPRYHNSFLVFVDVKQLFGLLATHTLLLPLEVLVDSLLVCLDVVGDGQHFALVPGKRVTQQMHFSKLTKALRGLDPFQILPKLSVSIWRAMSEVNSVVVVLESVMETQSWTELDPLQSRPLIGVLSVRNLKASSVSSQLLVLVFELRPNQRLHSVLIQTLQLLQIQNWKLYSFTLLCVLDWKVKPLSVSCSLGIML